MTIQQAPLPPATEAPRGTLSLWAGVVGAPMMWACQLQIGYALVPWICGHGRHFLLHLVTIVFTLLALAGFYLCYRDYAAVSASPAAEDQLGPGRAKFLAILGMMTSAFFTLVIIAQGLASFFIHPCWD